MTDTDTELSSADWDALRRCRGVDVEVSEHGTAATLRLVHLRLLTYLACSGCYRTSPVGRLLLREHDRAVAAAVPRWEPIESAPRNGTPIVLWIDGEPVKARWAEYRKCMLAGVSAGAGQFGPGWEDTDNRLVITGKPTHWTPCPKEADRAD